MLICIGILYFGLVSGGVFAFPRQVQGWTKAVCGFDAFDQKGRGKIRVH